MATSSSNREAAKIRGLHPYIFLTDASVLRDITLGAVKHGAKGTMVYIKYKGGDLYIQDVPSRVMFDVTMRTKFDGKVMPKPKMEIVKNITKNREDDEFDKFQTSMSILEEHVYDLIRACPEVMEKKPDVARKMADDRIEEYFQGIVQSRTHPDYGENTTHKFAVNLNPVFPLDSEGKPDTEQNPTRYDIGQIKVKDMEGTVYEPTSLVRNTLTVDIFRVAYVFVNKDRGTFGTFAHTVQILEFPPDDADAEFDLAGFDVPRVKNARKRAEEEQDEKQAQDEFHEDLGEIIETAPAASASVSAAESEAEAEAEDQGPPSITSLMRSSKKPRAN